MNGKVCVPCELEMYPKENGVFVMEYANGKPYKLWSADLWACHSCNAEIVVGFARDSVVEHYEPQFPAVVAKIKESGKKIIDCFESIKGKFDARARV